MARGIGREGRWSPKLTKHRQVARLVVATQAGVCFAFDYEWDGAGVSLGAAHSGPVLGRDKREGTTCQDFGKIGRRRLVA